MWEGKREVEKDKGDTQVTEASQGVYLVQNRMWCSLGKW